MPWAYIQEDSYFFMPKQERGMMLFENLPYPFSRNNDLDATTIVMPDNPQSQDLIIAGRIAELLGISVDKNAGVINSSKGKAFTERQRTDNLVIFGCPGENSAIKAVNGNLWFKYNNGFTAVLSNEKYELLPETSKTASFFELKPSPYNNDKGMLTITSLNKKSLLDSITYFDDDNRGLLTGDAAIVSKDGDLVTLRFQKEDNTRPVINNPGILSKDIWNYVIFAGAVLLLMAVGFAFYLYKNNKDKKNKRSKTKTFTRNNGRRGRGRGNRRR